MGAMPSRSKKALAVQSEFIVAVHDQKSPPVQRTIEWVGQLPCDLDHERAVRIRCHAGDTDAARCQVNGEQQVVGDEPSRGPHFNVKKSVAVSTSQWALRNVAQVVRFRRKPASLLVGEPHPSPLQLFFQQPVLREQIVDHRLLITIHSTGYSDA